ncbi:hypothetical protein WK73_13745 [Burkholderia ubonensis]|nr:hypothetical protein WK73_13745 [Burkholderia ubonensis]KWC44211.1 hypothetical protein WL52_24890 [Burkholderia ubonensis]
MVLNDCFGLRLASFLRRLGIRIRHLLCLREVLLDHPLFRHLLSRPDERRELVYEALDGHDLAFLNDRNVQILFQLVFRR